MNHSKINFLYPINIAFLGSIPLNYLHIPKAQSLLAIGIAFELTTWTTQQP